MHWLWYDSYSQQSKVKRLGLLNMLNARIVETIACSKCYEHKPYPSDYIVSYTKSKTESMCAKCREIRRKECKIKREGKTEKEACWRDKSNHFNALMHSSLRKKKDD